MIIFVCDSSYFSVFQIIGNWKWLCKMLKWIVLKESFYLRDIQTNEFHVNLKLLRRRTQKLQKLKLQCFKCNGLISEHFFETIEINNIVFWNFDFADIFLAGLELATHHQNVQLIMESLVGPVLLGKLNYYSEFNLKII